MNAGESLYGVSWLRHQWTYLLVLMMIMAPLSVTSSLLTLAIFGCATSERFPSLYCVCCNHFACKLFVCPSVCPSQASVISLACSANLPKGLYILPMFYLYWALLGPFYGAIAVPSVTRCRCRRCCCCGCGHRRAAARSEWAQHVSNASCFIFFIFLMVHFLTSVSQKLKDWSQPKFQH